MDVKAYITRDVYEVHTPCLLTRLRSENRRGGSEEILALDQATGAEICAGTNALENRGKGHKRGHIFIREAINAQRERLMMLKLVVVNESARVIARLTGGTSEGSFEEYDMRVFMSRNFFEAPADEGGEASVGEGFLVPLLEARRVKIVL